MSILLARKLEGMAVALAIGRICHIQVFYSPWSCLVLSKAWLVEW